MTSGIWITLIICATVAIVMTMAFICDAVEAKYKYLNEHQHEEATIVLSDTEKRYHTFKITKDGFLKESEGDEKCP